MEVKNWCVSDRLGSKHRHSPLKLFLEILQNPRENIIFWVSRNQKGANFRWDFRVLGSKWKKKVINRLEFISKRHHRVLVPIINEGDAQPWIVIKPTSFFAQYQTQFCFSILISIKATFAKLRTLEKYIQFFFFVCTWNG